MTTLDRLIQQRTGGAVNVRGIRFQVLYTLARAFEAQASGRSWSVTPEGLEDVDVQIDGVTDHVQVKTSVNRWAKHDLKKALASIVEAAQACAGDPSHTFTVLLSGDVNNDVAALAGRADAAPSDRERLDAALAKLLRSAGADPTTEARLAPTLTIGLLDEDRLADALRRGPVEAFDAHPGGANVAVDALAAFVLDRARLRRPFGPPEFVQAFAAVAHGTALLAHFDAVGRHLIGPVDWTTTAPPDDFVEGRGTRAGHIAAGLDVARPRWTRRIAAALDATGLCIVRAPSGQGKSALALRYALDHWDAASTLTLRACATEEAAAQVSGYLRARADIGLVTYLLIDGADWRLQHWPDVAIAARDRGIPTLVTVRVEDWRRFAVGSAADLEAELVDAYLQGDSAGASEGATGPLADTDVVEPSLDLDEARDLFAQVRCQGRVHPSVESAEEAFERVGDPALLMEFLFLVTQGELLRHRLGGQIRELMRGRDDAHLGLLRLASLAHACGVALPADAAAGFEADPQRVLSQIDGEYVRCDGPDLAELHRVRSEHLARLLHEHGPSPATTALRILALLPDARLAPFVAGALRYPGIDAAVLHADLVGAAVRRGPRAAAAIADGLFEAGERAYAETVAPVFKEARAILGDPGPFFLSVLLAPTRDPAVFDGLIDVADSMPNGAGDGFRALRDAARAAPEGPRGYDRVAALLGEALPLLAADALVAHPAAAGRLLQDAGRVGVSVSVADIVEALPLPDADDLPSLATLLLGLDAHAPGLVRAWTDAHAEALGDSAAVHLSLVGPPVFSDGPDGPALEVAFYPDEADGAPSLNDQSVSGLQLLRQLYPHVVHFRSRAHWIWPAGLLPSVDDSVKDMVARYLLPPLHRDRQGFWTVLVQGERALGTFWAFQKAWHERRSLALGYVVAVETLLRAVVEGRPFTGDRFEKDDLEVRFLAALRAEPVPPVHTSPLLRKAFQRASSWMSLLSNVTRQWVAFADDRPPDAGRLLRGNAYELARTLPQMHAAFDVLFEHSPDSFGLRDLRAAERRAYGDLARAIEFWTDPPVSLPVTSLRKELVAVHAEQDDALRLRVASALADVGVEPSLPPVVLRDGMDGVVALALPLPHSCATEPDRFAEALVAIADLGEPSDDAGRPDTLWLAFTSDGVRHRPDALRLFSHQLRSLADGADLNWEAFVPLPPPDRVARAFDVLPRQTHPLVEAWQAAQAARLLGARIEACLAHDLDDPRVVEKLTEMTAEGRTALLALAARVHVLGADDPAVLDAAERLGVIADALGAAHIPVDEIVTLLDDLETESLGHCD